MVLMRHFRRTGGGLCVGPIALALMLSLGFALGGTLAYAAPHTQSDLSLTLADLRNTEYRNLNTASGLVQLTDGLFEDAEAGVKVILTDFYAIGDLNGDGADDAVVILATETTGSSFISLAGVVAADDTLTPAGVVLLGDRVQVNELSVANGIITVDYLRLRPTDDPCCPSQAITTAYVLRRGLLVPYQPRAFGRLFPYQEGQLYGYVNVLGQPVIPAQFALASDFSEGLAAISYDGRSTGYINQLGELVIEPLFSYGGPFQQGMAIVGVPGVDANRRFLTGFINRDGRFVFDDVRFAAAEPFREGLAVISLDGERYGYIDLVGNIVIEPQFTYAESFGEGLAPVRLGEEYGFIDRTGRFVIPPQFEAAEPFREGRAQVVVRGKTGYINHSGEMVIEPAFDYGGDFSNGRALVALDSKLGYIDEAGNLEVDLPNMTRGDDFAEGLAPVMLDGQYGYIDLQGNLVIPPQFSYAGRFSNGLAAFETAGSWGIINNIGEVVLEIPRFDRSVRAQTELVEFVPTLPEAVRSGSCNENSRLLDIASAWRCTIDAEVFDPCLVGDDGETLVCNTAPATDGLGFRLALNQPLPDVSVTAEPLSAVWQMRLDDGLACTLISAVRLTLDDKPVTHVCTDAQVLLGVVDQSSDLWTVEKAIVVNDEQGEYAVESSTTVAILTVWQATEPQE